jgi:hypothetical protein
LVGGKIKYLKSVEENKKIMLVLRSGGDFTIKDVELIARHINGNWKSSTLPKIYCLWDKAADVMDLGGFTLLPFRTTLPGTWARMHLYSPEMEQYRPFLYVDLDTAIINTLENIFDLVTDQSKFITLEDFWQKGSLATGLVWFPAHSKKIQAVWNAKPDIPISRRMDGFLRRVVKVDMFWQALTNTIVDFKPRKSKLLNTLPVNTNLVCFHGKPRIPQAQSIEWVKQYMEKDFARQLRAEDKVTVVIPYNRDRGWLQQAIGSIPKGVQLLLSKGDGNWPQNFNKVLNQATGKYIRWLHEDDMLTDNSIEDSVYAIESQDVDFIHGNAYELFMNVGRAPGKFIPKIKIPTVQDLLGKNFIHSETLLYKREVFEKVGGLDETLQTAEEREFNLRCLQAGLKIGYCDSFLAWYRRHPQQKVRTISKSIRLQERQMVRSKYV